MANEQPIGALTPELKAQIDAMSRTEMCRLWRFAPAGHPCLTGLEPGTAGHYFSQRLKSLGGFSSEISKQLGWK